MTSSVRCHFFLRKTKTKANHYVTGLYGKPSDDTKLLSVKSETAEAATQGMPQHIQLS